MPNSILIQAVRNNAEWCNLVAASHMVPTEWDEQTWHAIEKMPPFYPNIVTLKEDILTDRVLEIVDTLPEHCGWKDSFADLDLTNCGFKPGFEAQWYGNSEKAIPRLGSDLIREVSSTDELKAWISAWGETPNGETIFQSNLLQPKVRFLFRRNNGDIDAGIIINFSDNVVGISNTFGQFDGISQCIVAAQKIGNGRALVGYGSEDEVDALKELGFSGLGELKVWLR